MVEEVSHEPSGYLSKGLGGEKKRHVIQRPSRDGDIYYLFSRKSEIILSQELVLHMITKGLGPPDAGGQVTLDFGIAKGTGCPGY